MFAMPVPGRKPKPEGQARNRNRPAHDWTEVPDLPFDGPAPKLWKKRRVMLPFGNFKDVVPHAMTRDWWESVASMPHCRLWSETDWQYALATSLVADAFYYGHGPSATELARREKVLGTTVDARRDLRIRYVEPKDAEAEAAGVTHLDDYRDV